MQIFIRIIFERPCHVALKLPLYNIGSNCILIRTLWKQAIAYKGSSLYKNLSYVYREDKVAQQENKNYFYLESISSQVKVRPRQN